MQNFIHIFRLGSDPGKLFPFELMQEHLRKFAKYGLILSTVLLPIITLEDDYVTDFESIGESVENGSMMSPDEIITENSRRKLYKRLRDIVYDMITLRYI